MRVCLVSQEYPPETGHGGIATQTRLKALGLARLGHEVVVLSHAVGHDRTDRCADGVRVVRVPGPDARMAVHTDAVRWLEWSGDVARALDALHAERPFDLVDVPEYGGEAFVYLLNGTVRPPVVVHLHGSLSLLSDGLGWPAKDSDLFRIGTTMESTCIRLADRVYSSSELSARACGRNGVIVLHSGVDVPAEAAPRRSRRRRITFVGKIGPSKGADVLVDAVLAATEAVHDIVLDLWGTPIGSWGEELARRGRAVGRPDVVRLHGFLDHERFGAVMAETDVFASPSPFEAGPGFVFLEAMAHGVPVVGCAGTGIVDVVHHDVNGLLVPVGDTGSLTDALRALLLDDALHTRLATGARRWVEEHADTRSCVRRIASFYEQVVAA